ncbi:Phosphoglycolate phosphatase [Brevundimonas sp. NIBR10]|jgi:putative hydrolase of the HAD superfamily|uniref:HAD family hydrolase n=3 Tax=Brevundimonas TaxID=41275 RepID=A0A4Y9RWU0_9CAUL|nr:HAD family hydrolase [Brevundimonas sp.]ASE39284.1 HAD family hydrolase [Brevundimonas vesicularis]PZO08814.1 MAG: HAD family hydrolase [Alphaproteobacteria bacterium]TFW13610.1 HAD family hydrolase [Brevundimonas intermedia]WGM45668.1 Phosphoglycolate phosphatase [Brevundimonas sp. NIBR10]VDC49687.1 Phosphoglycolate phosphatase, chromosomal [Brevundimonas mediterranea]
MTAGRRIRAVVIDLDDTLLSAYRRPDLAWRSVCQVYQTELGDLAPDVAARALTEAGRAFWSDPDSHAVGRADPKQARRVIAAKAFEALRRDSSPTVSPEIAERIADAFSLHRDRQMRLEPKADAVLVQLRDAGYRLALLTNGAGPLQRAKIERFGLASRFHHIQIEGEVGVGKPDPGAFRRVFAALNVDPPEVCVVGDSLEWDIRPAKALGCFTILYDPEAGQAVGRGFGDAHVVTRTLASLAPHLQERSSPPGRMDRAGRRSRRAD